MGYAPATPEAEIGTPRARRTPRVYEPEEEDEYPIGGYAEEPAPEAGGGAIAGAPGAAGVMDGKRARGEAAGALARARDILRQRGLAAAAKRATRETREGVVESYIHAGGRIGALVELTSETDFVARNPEFRELAKNIAMQIAAMSPLVVSEEDLSAEERAELVREHGDDQRALEAAVLLRQP